MHLRRVLLILLPLLSASVSGCGILIGNVKPVEEKADDYGVIDLSKESSDWAKLKTEEKSQDDSEPTEVSDVAFQSRSTASIISLNSACRPSHEQENESLRDFTRLLLLGLTDISLRDEKEMKIQGAPALQTTVRGRLNGEPVMIRTVVLRKETCVYDLMYVARPDSFDRQEPDFSRFVNSLRIR